MPLIVLILLLLFGGGNWLYSLATVTAPFHLFYWLSGGLHWLGWFWVAVFVAWCFDD